MPSEKINYYLWRIIKIIIVVFVLVVGIFSLSYFIDNRFYQVIFEVSDNNLMNEQIQNSPVFIAIKKNLFYPQINIKEGDLVIYKKYKKYFIRRIASLRGSRYFYNDKQGYYQYKNIKIRNSQSSSRFVKSIESYSYGGIIDSDGVSINPAGTIVVSDAVNDVDHTVKNYDVINTPGCEKYSLADDAEFIGLVYPLNKQSIKLLLYLYYTNIKNNLDSNL